MSTPLSAGRPVLKHRPGSFRALLAVAALLAGTIAPAVVVAATAAALPAVTQDVSPLSPFDAEILRLTNVQRAAAGLTALQEARGLDSLSTWWSNQQSNTGVLAHNPNGFAMVTTYGAAKRTVWGENVIKWSPNTATAQQIFDAYFASPTHKANLLSKSFAFIGIGTVTNSLGVSFNTINFTDVVDAGQTFDPIVAATPAGQFETATLTGATVRVLGWAVDPDITTAASAVQVTDIPPTGVSKVTTATANATRTDIGARYPKSGNAHGIDYSFVTSGRGTHSICLTILNQGVGVGNVGLGCISYVVGNPVGSFTTATRSGSVLTLSGWAVDPDQPTAAATVTVTDKLGTATTTTKLVANQANTAAGTAIPGAGNNHGFAGTATITGAGDHTVCATVAAISSATIVTDLGCKTVNVAASSKPVGLFSAATVSGHTLSVSGWAVDPSALTASATVTVTDKFGTASSVSTFVANQVNAAGGTAVPGAGNNHGFAGTAGISGVGSHSVCATVASIGTPTVVTDLGCKTVTVVASKPVGLFSAATVAGHTLSVSGWAVDPDALTSSATVTVTDKFGTASSVSTFVANQVNAAGGTAVPGAGNNHGFAGTAGISGVGSHSVCATVASIGTPTVVTDLGCKTVTVVASKPVGLFSAATVAGHTLSVSGWAVDPDALTSSATVTVTDKFGTASSVSTFVANQVNAAGGTAVPGAGNNHGFAGTAGISGVGSHSVCATVASIGTPTVVTDLGCKTVTVVASKPVGLFSAATVAGHTLSVSGWAVDPDALTSSATVTVTDKFGTASSVSTFVANQVNAAGGTAVPGAGNNHGFAGTAGISGVGSHSVCATVASIGTPTVVTDLGCKTVTVVATKPVGLFASVASVGHVLTMTGWAIDPDALASPVTVTLTDTFGTAVVTTKLVANQVNAAGGTAVPGAGNNHGFAGTASTSGLGVHTVCATIASLGTPTLITDLGCRTVTVTASQPVGSFDAASRTGSTLTVSGWAVDPDALASPATVTVTDKLGASTATFTLVANQVNAAGGTAVPGAGNNHGFAGTAPISGIGDHSICATVASLSTPTLITNLGCKTVTIPPSTPIGAFDTISAPNRNTVAFTGWAADPDFPTAAVTLNVTITNSLGTTSSKDTVANLVYPKEVAPGFGVNHAFNATMPLVSDGVNTVCISAVSRTDSHVVGDLGCKDVTVTWLTGNLDKVSTTTVGTVRTINVFGWDLDRGALTTPASVRIDVTAPDGTVTTNTVVADAVRTDVGNAVPGAGNNHGFNADVTVGAAGTYQVCTTALSAHGSGTSKTFPCQTIAVK